MPDYIAHVTVTIPVHLSFDDNPTPEDLRDAAKQGFTEHPASDDYVTMESYLDGIVYEKQCFDCDNEGWLLAENSDHGLRIERCDSCKKFVNDDEAVTFVAAKARG